jgi:hypothetical protein
VYAYASETSGTISHSQHFAWSNNSGWVNWDANGGNVSVTDTVFSGYLWSANNGWINLSPTQGGVTNDGEGNLGGFAWDSSAGWIDFTGVHIGTDGRFTGQTTSNPNFGIMTFDCSQCAVATDWRPASTRAVLATSNGSGEGGASSEGISPAVNPSAPSPGAISPLTGTTVAGPPSTGPPATPGEGTGDLFDGAVESGGAAASPENLFDVGVESGEAEAVSHWLAWITFALAGAGGFAFWRFRVAWQ